MLHECLKSRLDGLLRILQGVHEASANSASATSGTEREQFINLFLDQVMPAPYRFGTGVAIDTAGHRSGQLDIVVEYPFLPSFPLPGLPSRLYLAESVAGVIEVKSNASNQWDQVKDTAEALAPLQHDLGYHLQTGIGRTGLNGRIPLIVVAYKGWKKGETLLNKLTSSPVDGILIIESAIFATSIGPNATDGVAAGAEALWCFIQCLHSLTSVLNTASEVSMPPYRSPDDPISSGPTG